jgi:hypothetical protein
MGEQALTRLERQVAEERKEGLQQLAINRRGGGGSLLHSLRCNVLGGCGEHQQLSRAL